MSFWKKKSKSDEYLAEARKYKRRGEYDRAGDYFFMAGAAEQALQMYEKGGHHQLAAQLLEKLGEGKRAAEHYTQARNWRAAANLYEKLGERKRASQLFERLGEYYKAAEIEESLKSFRRAAELYVRAGQRDRAASAYARNRDFSMAAKVMQEFLDDGGAAVVKEKAERQWAQCADLHARAGNHGTAAAILERIHRPLEAARAYEEGGDLSKAIELFLKAGEAARAAELHGQAPDGSIRPEVLAELLEARGEFAEAGRLFRELGEPARAADCFNRAGDRAAAAEQYERDGELEMAAEMAYAAGDYAKASALYEGALRVVSAAGAAEKAGDLARAARLFTDAGERLDAARCWSGLGDADKAIAALQEVPATHEKYLEACVMLGDAFRSKGLGSIAREKYEAAIAGRAIDGSTLPAYYGLAILHQEAGEVEPAISIFERILATSFSFADVAERVETLRNQRSSTTPAPTAGTSSPTLPGLASSDTRIMAGELSAGSGVVGGRYELVGRLATSPRGEVYKAWDSSLGRTVVLKRLVPEDEDEGQVHRYVHEAQQASKLHHSNIAAIYDAVDQADGRIVAMEYVFGKSLRDLLRGEGHFSPGRAVEVANQILLALEYAHANGVTHRNLRPENVLVAEKSHVKLTDFGMNRRFGDVNKDAYDEASPIHYMSPEQIRGEKIDHRADLYTVGCLLYEMLLGRPPFIGTEAAQQHLDALPESLSAQDPSIPALLETVVLQCLEKDRNQRYQSARQVLDALRSFDFMPGQRIAERYELLREIGSGGMGKVYLAKDLELEETIAMKVLRPEFSTDAQLEQRFIREIKLARKIGHESVVKVFDFGKWNDVKFITMEYIDGISLDEYVRRRGRPDAVEVAKLMVQICDALDAAHRIGVIHRDMKPQNVLITPEGAAKIVDFGIARLDQHEDLTSSRHIIGSPKYMSPEQIQGKDVDHRTDIYAVGVVLYYCFTGMEPFAAADTNAIIVKQLREMPTPPTQVNPALPPWTDLVVLRCLAKEPGGRYASAAELAAALRAEI